MSPGERLRKLDSCAVSDALDRLGLAGAVSGLVRLSTDTRIAGRVRTVKLEAAGAQQNAPHLGTRAIEIAEPGDLIVVEQRTGLAAAGWGGILSFAAKAKGVGGVIVDGPVRDVDEARARGFPVFARSATPRTARRRVVEIACGEPVRIGDVEVHDGDYAIADGSGVVFVPAAEIERVLEIGEEIARREAAIVRAIESGTAVTEAMDARYERMLND